MQQERTFEFNASMGEERRTLEFKGGPDVLTPQDFRAFMKKMKDVLGQYISGFRNGLPLGEKGYICFGAHDSGKINGIRFDEPSKQKDKVRQEYDDIIKRMHPPLINVRDCTIEFIRVLKGPTMPGALYVVIISTEVSNISPRELCWWDGEAFIKAEGTNTPMTPVQIEQHFNNKFCAREEQIKQDLLNKYSACEAQLKLNLQNEYYDREEQIEQHYKNKCSALKARLRILNSFYHSSDTSMGWVLPFVFGVVVGIVGLKFIYYLFFKLLRK